MKRTEPTGRPRRVLLVDDNRNGTPARRSALEEQGYEIGTATSGSEAIESFHACAFDLVVTDYKMPKMNGIELIVQLRQLQAEVPIIMLSGFAEAGGLTETSTGANLVLQKGNNECQQLVRAVNRLLTQRATRKPAASKQPPLLAKRKSV
jgi:CheY-like chemotaxis protein